MKLTIPRARMSPVSFKELVLGFDSADYEATHHPDLLLRGFVGSGFQYQLVR
jgi:hypothetical protein